ncbi:MAG TPA: hypothetical protein VJX66_09315 [Amycolatopsis sp.]|nr:hypothetical protein [Amycolatopsis sp.]
MAARVHPQYWLFLHLVGQFADIDPEQFAAEAKDMRKAELLGTARGIEVMCRKMADLGDGLLGAVTSYPGDYQDIENVVGQLRSVGIPLARVMRQLGHDTCDVTEAVEPDKNEP